MTCPDQQYDRLDSLGVRVSVINLGEAVRTVELWVEQQVLTFVYVTGAMASHRGRTMSPVMIGVGAPFDFVAGTERQAPVWAQRSGLEWAFRLCSEPRRLCRRYAYIVPMFTILALGELARQLAPFSRPAPFRLPAGK
jgi:UDP-N-acetyl-D-mannosaminuronic acid transferase (WecB/TagA/CpsF family)